MSEPIQRLRTDTHSQQTAASRSAQRSQGAEFATPEEAIRADTQRIVVPPGIRDRIARTTAGEPRAAPKSWWRRLLGGDA